jgi:hypothetical protein
MAAGELFDKWQREILAELYLRIFQMRPLITPLAHRQPTLKIFEL